jgi:5'-nucleotidase
MPPDVTGRYERNTVDVDGQSVAAYAVDASPALCTIHGVAEFARRQPDLIVSGINYGANLGTEVTISGTVGAALEGGAFGIPAIAVSLEMDPAYHLTGDDGADYSAAKTHTQSFARHALTWALPPDVHALSINVPRGAKPESPWRLTRLSQRRYFLPLAPDRSNGRGRPGYKMIVDPEQSEPDSDVRAVRVDHVVSVTPLSLNLTSRDDFGTLDACLRGESAACPDLIVPWFLSAKGPQRATAS